MFNSYGPGMRANDGRVVPTFIVKALKREPISIMGGDQLISLTYIDDMMDAIERVLFSDLCEPVEIGNAERVSIRQLAETIIELTDSKSELTFTPFEAKDERMPDLRKAKELGWNAKIDLIQGLTKAIDYFKNIV
jgi:nucleoside-diphosphate-sugar epimerase